MTTRFLRPAGRRTAAPARTTTATTKVARRPARFAAFAAALAMFAAAGCASFAPGATPLGTPLDTARHDLFGRTGEHPLPGGGTRLEYAQGSFGKQTWMLDFDASGRLVAKQQVLTPQNFAAIQPGMGLDEVATRLGRPADVINVPWQKRQVWNYRFLGGDCVWFQVSLDAAGKVVETNQAPDPACDGPDVRN